MKNKVLYLVIGIPVVAVLMGMFTLYLAITHADPGVQIHHTALTKTSWRNEE